ncbi:MAG: hypothetical protein EU531_09130 [Promethearchaeota archaeon]|nr:MAG: hypothetical protein EU531_09130 [Candidatus Lokiarchaeota archaeon]
MAKNFKEIEISCPVCNKSKKINIPEQIFNQKKFGIIRVQVPQGGVCQEHQFIVFIDTKGIIRGYEKIDLQLKSTSIQAQEKGKFTLNNFVRLFGLYGVFCLIHAKIFNYPAFIIQNEEIAQLSGLINRIGNALLPENYRDTSIITFLDKIDYNEINLKEKNALLIDDNLHILQIPWDEKLKFEEELIKPALEILNENEQLKLVQQGIITFIRQAEYVKSLLEKVKFIDSEDLIEKMSRELVESKVNNYRVALIKDFISQRYSTKLAEKIKNKVEEFLKFL